LELNRKTDKDVVDNMLGLLCSFIL